MRTLENAELSMRSQNAPVLGTPSIDAEIRIRNRGSHEFQLVVWTTAHLQF